MGCSCDKVQVDDEDKKDKKYTEEGDIEEEDEKEENLDTNVYKIESPNKVKKIKKSIKKKNNIENKETIPDDRLLTNPREKKELEDTILEIEKEEMEICNLFIQ